MKVNLYIAAIVVASLLTGCAVDLTAKSGNKYRFSFDPSVEQLQYFAK